MRAAIADKAHIKQVYRALEMFKPEVLEEIKPKLLKPEPVFYDTVLLPQLLKKFCELKNVPEKLLIGVRNGRESVQLKRLFIGVIIKLYDPQLLTRIHSEVMKHKLRAEMAKLMTTDRSWISQVANDIITQLNPHNSKLAFEDYRSEVNRLSKVLEIEFSK
jgi:hypothetical protein